MRPFTQSIIRQNDTQQTLFSTDSAVSSIQGKKVALDFKGGSITSDAGVLVLSEVDKKIGLIETLTQCIGDTRNPFFIRHTVRELLSQRIFQIACGYEPDTLIVTGVTVTIQLQKCLSISSNRRICIL